MHATGLILDIAKGKAFTIALDSNHTTGFRWNVLYDKGAITFVSNTYAPQTGQKVGAGGHDVFTFRAKKKGPTTLIFAYARSWEKQELPAEMRVYTVSVQ